MSEDWLHDAEEKRVILDEKEYLLGGSDRAKYELKREFTNPDDEDKAKADLDNAEKKIILVTKVIKKIEKMKKKKKVLQGTHAILRAVVR